MQILDDFISFFKVPEADKEIIQQEIKHENIKRIFYLSLIGAPASFLHIIFFSFNLNDASSSEYNWKISILTIHSFITCFLILVSSVIYFSFIRERKNLKPAQVCVTIVTLILMVGGSVISAIDQQVTTAINPFIVTSTIAAIVLLTKPINSILYYVGSYICFYFLMENAQPNPDILISNKVNAITFSGISLCISFIFWRLHLTRYRQHKLIELQKNELEENYNKLKFYSEELKESNSTKDKLISVIAHDFRSPLASLINVTKLLSEDFDIMSREEAKNIMISLHKETELTYETLNNLLVWSKTQQKKLEPVFETANLYKLVESATVPIQSIYKQKVITFTNNTDRSIEVMVDLSMIQSVIKNLIINAIKFSYEGGDITVNTNFDENFVTVAIQDSGIGMAPEILETLFKSGSEYTTIGTQNEKGTGLGLQICKEFVELNEGQIWAKSEPGKGSTFYFSLRRSTS